MCTLVIIRKPLTRNPAGRNPAGHRVVPSDPALLTLLASQVAPLEAPPPRSTQESMWPLLIAANRDELLARPWRLPSLIDQERGIVAPIDCLGGGTWIGHNRHGIVTAITNRRFGTFEGTRPSRGRLCATALKSTTTREALAHVRADIGSAAHNPFNLLVADQNEAFVLQYGEEGLLELPLPPGVHIITNLHDLDASELEPLCEHARTAYDLPAMECVRNLETLLTDHTVRGTRGHSVCKHSGPYGTVCSSVIGVSAEGHAHFWFAPGPPCHTPFTLLDAGQVGAARALESPSI